MSLENYKRTIEEYIAKKDNTVTHKDAAKGLLAPKSGKNMPEVSKKQKDTISNIAEFVYMLRQKRREIAKARMDKKGTKKNGK